MERINKMNKKRDSFVNGLNVIKMKREKDKREKIREGW